MKRLLTSIILLLTAIVLFALAILPGLACAVVMVFVKDTRERYPAFADYVLAVAVAIDILGNVLCAALFNLTLVKHGGYCFGRTGETVSSALGVNQLRGTLSRVGNGMARLLDRIDKNHCAKAAKMYHEGARERLQLTTTT